jgi:hypothetical protein
VCKADNRKGTKPNVRKGVNIHSKANEAHGRSMRASRGRRQGCVANASRDKSGGGSKWGCVVLIVQRASACVGSSGPQGYAVNLREDVSTNVKTERRGGRNKFGDCSSNDTVRGEQLLGFALVVINKALYLLLVSGHHR